MRKIYPIALVLFLALIGLQSCNLEYFDFEKTKPFDYKPSIALPLVEETMDVYDVLATFDSTDLVIIDETDGFVGLVYDEINQSVNVMDFFTFPDESSSNTLQLSGPQVTTFLVNGSISLNYQEQLDLDPGMGIELHEALVKVGDITIDINSQFQHSGELTFELPTATKNGIPFTTTVPFTYAGSVPVIGSEVIDLAGYDIDFTVGNTTTNTVPYNLIFTLNGSGNPIAGTEELTYSITMGDVEFTSIFGDFGTTPLEVPTDSIILRIFSNALGGTFVLTNPTINFTIQNSYGIPFQVDFTSLQSVNINDQSVIELGGPGVEDPKLLEAAPNPGQFSSSNFFMNGMNTTNIQNVISPTPKYLRYNLAVTSNPAGPASPLNFITDESELELTAEIILPMEGYARDFVMMDTVALNFGDEDAIEEIESISMRTLITNGFPVNGRLQVYYLKGETILDSLYENGVKTIIESAIVPDGQIRVSESTFTVADTEVDRAKLANILDASHIIIRAEGETPDAQNDKIVRIYADYEMTVKLSLLINADILID